MNIWKVVHVKDGVETVYLISADTRREAESTVLDSLYERQHCIEIAPERLANDPFGLLAASQTQSWTNYALCKQHGCSVSATPFTAVAPYKLYAINTKTGEMS